MQSWSRGDMVKEKCKDTCNMLCVILAMLCDLLKEAELILVAGRWLREGGGNHNVRMRMLSEENNKRESRRPGEDKHGAAVGTQLRSAESEEKRINRFGREKVVRESNKGTETEPRRFD